MIDNIITLTDSYKTSHYDLYPDGTEYIYSYFESRGGRWNSTGFFGLQYYLKKYLQGYVVNSLKIAEAEKLFGYHGVPYNKAGWEYIRDQHMGKLPVRIKAVPEGSIVPTGNVLMTIENTDPKVPWLTNYLETILVHMWSPSTVQINSYECKKVIRKYLELTGDPAGLNFKLHDFGFRGVSSVESAAMSGAAHLLNFAGTDTLAALSLINEYYSEGSYGFSIPATEHSVMSILGKEGELSQMRRVLDKHPTGLVACVSDTYDILNACSNYWGKDLKDQVIEREGVLIVRPDSGEPTQTVLKVIEILMDKFGYDTNNKGYKVLPPYLRVIQGDGIDLEMIKEILFTLKKNFISADNLAFGSGGGLLQKFDRDTQRFAFKCSAAKVNGEWRDVWKDPVTDSGKRSKRGKLKLVKEDGVYSTEPLEGLDDELVTVFENGSLTKEWTFDECRKRAEF